MTKWVKKTVIGFLVLLIAGSLWVGKKVLDQLPSQQKIAAAIQSAKSPNQKDSAASSNTPVSNSNSAQKSDALLQDPQSRAKLPESTVRRTESAAELLAVVEEDPRDIRVCENLGRSRFNADDALSSGLQFDALFQSKRDDSVIEAVRFPVRAIFQDPSVASLLRELDGLEKEGVTKQDTEKKESTLEKIGFYGRVMKAGSALYLNRRHYESIGDRAVHLRTIAKLAMISPEMANNSRVLDFCREVENAGGEVSDSALQAERTKLLGLISTLGLKPEQLGFDPAEHVKFSVQASKTGFSFSLSDRTAAE